MSNKNNKNTGSIILKLKIRDEKKVIINIVNKIMELEEEYKINTDMKHKEWIKEQIKYKKKQMKNKKRNIKRWEEKINI